MNITENLSILTRNLFYSTFCSRCSNQLMLIIYNFQKNLNSKCSKFLWSSPWIIHFHLQRFSVGIAGNFCSSYSKWSALYPGLRPKLATLHLNTLLPVLRELFLSVGICSVSANSLTTLLNQSNDPTDKLNRDGYTANAVAIVVGGVREQRHCTYPNKYKFVLKTRRGFVRIALQTGASLVPAISFGENDYYDIVEYKWLQRIFNNANNFPTFSFGRGYFQYNLGLLPRRHPITTVIGAPIHLDKILNPSDAEIFKIHELFCNRITDLFEEHKSKYVENYENVHLEFIWFYVIQMGQLIY